MTGGLTEAQRAALRQLARLWSSRPFVLIGAMAIECQLPMRRVTADLDLTVAVSMAEFPAGVDQLAGWVRHPAREHGWTGPGDVRVNIIPVGPDLLARGWIEWASGHRMNVVGLAHAFDHSVDVNVGDQIRVKVASLPVLALLKMVSYLDRPAERRHDLEDLGFLLEEAISADDERRWSDEILAAQLAFEVTSAFILGQEIGRFSRDLERALVAEFVACARANRFATLSELARLAPRAWRKDEDTALALLEALAAGAGLPAP